VLRQIQIAIENYCDASNNAYPPARTSDTHGRHLQSWRALIMPYLGYYSFREQYDYSSPWNSAKNRNWSDRGVSAFVCPSEPREGMHFTNYVAVIGPETMWPGSESAHRPEIVNADAILIVEYPESDIPWNEPRDLTVEEFLSLFEARLARNGFGPHPHGLPYVTVGGEVRSLDHHTDRETARQLLRARKARAAGARKRGHY
jgi:hypothetical protein